MKHEQLITQCQAWVYDFIAKRAICPFAKPVIDNGQVGWVVIDTDNLEDQLISLMGQVQTMLASEEPETLLLIMPAYQVRWLDYLTMIECANQLLEGEELLKELQIASFHPDYQFEGEPANSESHFTNRSPWPMVHLIRQSSISRVLETYPNPEQIPKRNIELMGQLGRDFLMQQLATYQRQNTD